MIINNEKEKEGNFNNLLTILNNNLFNFTMREYYSNNIEPFTAIKLLLKIIHSNPNDQVLRKCASLFYSILKEICIRNKNIIKRVNFLIDEMLNIFLLKKNNFPIIIDHLLYKLSLSVTKDEYEYPIKKMDEFLSYGRFNNYTELLFYKVLINYYIKGDIKILITNFNKDQEKYNKFIIDFLIFKKDYKNIQYIITSKKFEGLNYFVSNNLNYKKYIGLLISEHSSSNPSNYKFDFDPDNTNNKNYEIVEEKDKINQIKEFNELLNKFPYNIELITKLNEMIEKYFSDNYIKARNLKELKIDLNLYKTISEKIIYFGEDLYINYVKFLFSYYFFSYNKKGNWTKTLLEILKNINDYFNNSKNKIIFLKNEENLNLLKKLIFDFYKNCTFNILKSKIYISIYKCLLKNDINNSHIKHIVKRIFKIINLSKEIITGEPLIIINEDFIEHIISKDFLIYIKKLA